jgi:hypothetical protein
MRESIDEELADLFSMPVMGAQLRNFFINNDIRTMSQLLAMKPHELLELRHLGRVVVGYWSARLRPVACAWANRRRRMSDEFRALSRAPDFGQVCGQVNTTRRSTAAGQHWQGKAPSTARPNRNAVLS